MGKNKAYSSKRMRSQSRVVLLLFFLSLLFQNCDDTGVSVNKNMPQSSSGAASLPSTTPPETAPPATSPPVTTNPPVTPPVVVMPPVTPPPVVIPPPAPVTCLFNGAKLNVGDTVKAYLTSSGVNCQSENRVCNSTGQLSGTYNFPSCTVQIPVSNSGVIWAAGTCGHLEKSEDNGLTFKEVRSITAKSGKVYNLQNYSNCSDYDHGGPALYGLTYGNGRLILATWAISTTLGSATTNNIRLYSDDKGATWSEFQSTAVLSQAFWKISYSTQGKYFLGSTHYGNRLVKSTDGINWSAVLQCNTDPVCKFRASAAAGKYFIVGGDGQNFFSGSTETLLTQTTVGASRSYAASSRIAANSDDFGVISGMGDSELAVVHGGTGYSGSIKLGMRSSYVFSASNKIFFVSGTSIYRADLSCLAQNQCSSTNVKVANINVAVSRAWFLNGYLYAVVNGEKGSDTSRIYRSTAQFDANSTGVASLNFQVVNSNSPVMPSVAQIKEMTYVP